MIKFWVKYIFALCALRTLFFDTSVLFCIKIGTCSMGKDGNGTSVHKTTGVYMGKEICV
jgi:hypothetical protein